MRARGPSSAGAAQAPNKPGPAVAGAPLPPSPSPRPRRGCAPPSATPMTSGPPGSMTTSRWGDYIRGCGSGFRVGVRLRVLTRSHPLGTRASAQAHSPRVASPTPAPSHPSAVAAKQDPLLSRGHPPGSGGSGASTALGRPLFAAAAASPARSVRSARAGEQTAWRPPSPACSLLGLAAVLLLVGSGFQSLP